MAAKTLLFLLATSLSATLCLCAIEDVPVLATPVPDPDPISFNSTDGRLGLGLLLCPCSGSGRGFRRGSEMMLKLGNATLGRARSAKNGSLHESALRARHKVARGIFKKCAKAFGIEACINAETKLRTLMPIALCLHDKTSGKNIMPVANSSMVITLGSCALSKATRSPGRSLSDADAKVEGGSDGNATKSGIAGMLKAEGCVAVEHLQGATLQHPRHLKRDVLCAGGFCATPNHAIEVYGRRTSMREMCTQGGGWQCVRSVKMVNNLKIAVNRRWRVSKDIVVTPYDLRFPVALCWAAQMGEDVWRIVVQSMVFGSVLSSVALVSSVLAGKDRRR